MAAKLRLTCRTRVTRPDGSDFVLIHRVPSLSYLRGLDERPVRDACIDTLVDYVDSLDELTDETGAPVVLSSDRTERWRFWDNEDVWTMGELSAWSEQVARLGLPGKSGG